MHDSETTAHRANPQDNYAAADLEKMGYKQEMTRVCLEFDWERKYIPQRPVAVSRTVPYLVQYAVVHPYLSS
jgi:hypothetical protein